MAATARRRGEPDDDIAAIAKQISDQAEAIYQNWKARGLAPNELLSCHAAGDTSKLGSMLKPAAPAKPSLEVLVQAPTMDNNRLEKLVKNFVHEDKARLAAAAANKNKPMPSSIQFALQKFERGGAPVYGGKEAGPAATVGVAKRNGSYSPSPSPSLQPHSPSPSPAQQHHSQLQKPSVARKPQISPKPSRFSDTIEMTLPVDLGPQTGPQGLQTWPLKNRVVKKAENGSGGGGTPHQNNTTNTYNHIKPVSKTVIDEVALEEKRLINALKNGDIVNEDPVPIVIPSKLAKEPDKTLNSGPKFTLPERTNGGMKFSALSDKTDGPGTKLTVADKSESAIALGPKLTPLRITPRRPEQQVPHPELTTSQKLHLRQAAANPVRPFLTRGSVAERVLIFERCPSDLLLDKRARAPAPQVNKPQPLPKQPTSHHTTLQRHVRAHRNVIIPRFHYPTGKPSPPGQADAIRAAVAAAFATIGERASREHFGTLARAARLPLYWKTPLCLAACADRGSCTLDQFMHFWQGMTSSCHDAASRFVYILTRGRRSWLVLEDFIPLVQDVVETHPGLTFLKEATEFHSRYVHTVIARIFYCVNRSWSGKISIPELRRSNLLNIIQLLEEEEDINQITQYFSYEHFYVIYCKFWELDRDHDLFIDKQDLTRHNDHALSTRIIDRIFSGCVTRGSKRQHEEKMSYTDFVWFLLSEEDKMHPTAIEYWFRCMDLDGDGFLSMYELEYFYEEQMQRMEAIGIETLPFQDCLCQMLDMVKPKTPGKVALSDLKKCKMTSIFFDTFFNLEKYLDHEQRDPFASQRDHDLDGQEMSDWDRYAAEEYELLVAEEGGNDQPDSLELDCGYDRLVR